ncbi:MAG TPA: carboxypeptidase-like regulatory domain-containing protein [Candidatus Polarisedimenticolia bacterium]|nr:carboxypeptidase-like regulatory domain-containing protein [Candidatus Polarisedimenticolia bacterium]
MLLLLVVSFPHLIQAAAAPSDLLLEPATAVLDLVGHGVPGVEVLVFPVGESDGPAAVLHTDSKGRFTLAALPAGSYMLALSKPGYRFHLARVNSALLSLLSIRLVSEAGAGVPGPAAGKMDWVLQLPTADVLKEEDAVPVRIAETPSAPTAASPRDPGFPVTADNGHRLPVRGDVNQWYTSTLAALGTGAQAPESTGRSTELQFVGELQGRGSWELQGMARTLSTDGRLAAQSGSETDQGSNRVKLAMNYRLTPADSIDVQARFDRDRYRAEGFPGEIAPADQEVRTLGYAANYTRKVNEAHRWGVGTDMVRAQARMPQLSTNPVPAPDAGDLTDWRWSAAADYQASLPRDHRISVAARTRIYRYEMRDEGWAIAPIQAGVIEAGERGWSLSFSGEDAWKVAGSVQLLLGLETHASEAWGRSVLLVPRVGARRESDSSLVQGWILVRGAGGGPEEPAQAGSDLPGSALGYHAEASRRFEGAWVVGGHVHRNALVAEMPTGAGDPATQTFPSALLADPGSWTQEIGVSVSKELHGVRGTLESDGGKVVGRVGSLLGEAPVQSLREGSARYLTLRASASVLKTDTRLHLDYTKLDGSEAAGAEVSSQVNLVVFQPIPMISDRGAGSWRVLFGYQGVAREAHPQEAALPGSEGPGKIHRFSGGVGVTF